MLRRILLGWIVLVGCAGSLRADFRSGNLVVVRVGDGSKPFDKGSAAPVFLDEVDLVTNSVVGSVALPTESNGTQRRLTLSMSATSEGQISTSSDGRFLILAGYDAPLLMAKVPSSTSESVPRVVARVSGSGRVETSTFLVDGYSKNNVRAALSVDGQRFYLAGAGRGGGLREVEAGGLGASKMLAKSPDNTRALAIFDGQLYVSTASGEFRGIVAIGRGLPVEQDQAAILVAPSPSNQPAPVVTGPESETPPSEPVAGLDPKPTGFVFLGGKLYVADIESGLLVYEADGTGPEGLPRFKLASKQELPGLACLTGRVVDGKPELYGTDGQRLLRFHLDGSTVTTRELARAGANQAFRGVAFAPTVVDEFAIPLPAVVAAGVAGLAGLAVPGALVFVIRRKSRRKIHYDGTDILVDGRMINP